MTAFLAEIIAFPTVIFTGMLGLALFYWIFVILGAIGIDAFDVDVDGLLEGGADGAVDAAVDGALDAAVDGALDAAVDGAMDAAVDGALDAALDGAMDAAVDGALDAAVDGAVDGALDAAVDGAVDASADGLLLGATDAALDGVAEGALDGVTDAAADGAADAGTSGHGFAWYLVHALALQKAPATVVLTLLSFWCWLGALLGMHYLAPLFGALPVGLTKTAIFAAASVLGVVLTNRTVQPMGRIFETKEAGRRQDILGSVCVVRTGRVDGRFGQAELDDGGAGLLIEIRADKGSGIGRGDRVLIIDYDPNREEYWVEPMDALLRADLEGTAAGTVGGVLVESRAEIEVEETM